jgi:hypothetical protein
MKLQGFCRLAIVLALLVGAVCAGQVRTDPCERPVTSPATGTVKLTLKGGQSVYHEGEIIPLERTFTYRLVQYQPKQVPILGGFLSASSRKGLIHCKTTKNQAFGEAPEARFTPAPMMCLILVSSTLTT